MRPRTPRWVLGAIGAIRSSVCHWLLREDSSEWVNLYEEVSITNWRSSGGGGWLPSRTEIEWHAPTLEIKKNKEWNSGDDQLRLRWMIYLVVLADAAESVRDTIKFDYHLSIRCVPFEALYGRKCRSPLLWVEIGESSLTGPDLVLETTYKVVLIKEKLKAARDHQKSYVDFRHKPLESEVGDRVLLKVSPWKGVVHFGKKGKLTPRYVGPFEILERIGLVAYRLRLPEELNSIHDTFHVSNLKKCLGNANLHVLLNEIKIDKTLHFVEEPVEIMDLEIKSLKRSRISLDGDGALWMLMDRVCLLAVLVRLQICDELDDTWAWVAPGPERQPNAIAGALEVAEGAPNIDEGAQAVPAHVQSP
ncbi:hypothetical protein Tco_0054430 [Tanacetum coccineum]